MEVFIEIEKVKNTALVKICEDGLSINYNYIHEFIKISYWKSDAF